MIVGEFIPSAPRYVNENIPCYPAIAGGATGFLQLNISLQGVCLRGIAQGRRSELVGGGLIRSTGGWSVVKAMRRVQDH